MYLIEPDENLNVVRRFLKKSEREVKKKKKRKPQCCAPLSQKK
jgi:hypothetical protein